MPLNPEFFNARGTVKARLMEGIVGGEFLDTFGTSSGVADEECSVSVTLGGVVYWSIEPIVWDSVTADVGFIVYYVDSGSDDQSPVIGYDDVRKNGAPRSISGKFTHYPADNAIRFHIW